MIILEEMVGLTTLVQRSVFVKIGFVIICLCCCWQATVGLEIVCTVVSYHMRSFLGRSFKCFLLVDWHYHDFYSLIGWHYYDIYSQK